MSRAGQKRLPPDPEQLPPGFVKLPTRPDRKIFTPWPNV